MRFSVVITTYNYAHLLPDTLRTIAAQTVSDFELLIVDDGSTDDTEKVVGHFRLGFRDCRYLKKPHTGLADTRNVAVQAARGSHIAFVDADDLWSPRYLGTVRKVFDANPEAQLVLCEGITFWSQDGIITAAKLEGALPHLRGPVRSPDELFLIIRGLSPSGMVFSKALYNQVGPFDVGSFGSFGNDLDWTFRALLAGASCICVNERLYLYRRHNDNMTNKASDSFRAWLEVYSQTLGGSRANPQIEALARRFIRSHAVSFLPTCSRHEGKLLLQRAIDTLDGDSYVRLCYIGTCLGLVSLLKLLKQIKRLSRRLLQKKLAIDLRTSYEAVFNALPK